MTANISLTRWNEKSVWIYGEGLNVRWVGNELRVWSAKDFPRRKR